MSPNDSAVLWRRDATADKHAINSLIKPVEGNPILYAKLMNQSKYFQSKYRTMNVTLSAVCMVYKKPLYKKALVDFVKFYFIRI